MPSLVLAFPLSKRAAYLPVWFWAPALVLLVAAWSLIAFLLHENRRSALEEASHVRGSLARSLAEHQESSLRAIDLSLRTLRATWLNEPAEFRNAVERQEEFLRGEHVIQVAVVDRNGAVAFSKLPQAGAANFADREYFRHHKASARDELHVSEPVFGRITGQWAIQISRPIHDRAGEFDGVLVVAVPVPALGAVYEDVELGPRSVVGLVRADGRLLARTGELAAGVAASFRHVPGLRPGDPPRGQFTDPGEVDAVERFFSYSRLRNYPLAVYVGQSTHSVLAAHRRARAMMLSGALLGTLLLFGVSALVFLRKAERARAMRAEAALASERERIMLELHDGSIQSIYGVGLHLEQARAVAPEDPAQAERIIVEAQARLNVIMQELREYMADSAPRGFSAEEFAAEIAGIVSSLAPWLQAKVDVEPEAVRSLGAARSAHVLRIVREAVSNAGRHASAKRVHISLRRADERLRLEVADDGIGLTGPGERRGAGLGLPHIRIRARKLHGRATIESEPGNGTRITVDFPSNA